MRRLSLCLALAVLTVSVSLRIPFGAQAAGTYKTTYSSMRYNYGQDLYDEYPDVPYVVWLLDFAQDQIHGCGNYEEKNGKGSGYELDAVCSTLIYYAIYCTGYNVPEYINISRDDDIRAVFEEAEEGEETLRNGWASSSSDKSCYVDGEKATGFTVIKNILF